MKKLFSVILFLALAGTALGVCYEVRNYCEDCVSYKYGVQSTLNPDWKAPGCETHTVRDFVLRWTKVLAESVLDRYDPTPGLPASPSAGDAYISTATANGWTIHYIYYYNGSAWEEEIPHEGRELWVEDEELDYAFDGSVWQAPVVRKAGSVDPGSFSGNPQIATVTFTTAFPDANYSVSLGGSDLRDYTTDSQAAGSFVINTNAVQALSAPVYWTAVAHYDP